MSLPARSVLGSPEVVVPRVPLAARGVACIMRPAKRSTNFLHIKDQPLEDMPCMLGLSLSERAEPVGCPLVVKDRQPMLLG